MILTRVLREFHNRHRAHGNSSTQRVGDAEVPRVFARNMTTDEIMRREVLIEQQRQRRALEALAGRSKRRSRSRRSRRDGGGGRVRHSRRCSGPAGISSMELDSNGGYSDDSYYER